MSASPSFNKKQLESALKLGLEVLKTGSPGTQQMLLDTLNESHAFRVFVSSAKQINEKYPPHFSNQ